jgi:hypothetical protein
VHTTQKGIRKIQQLKGQYVIRQYIPYLYYYIRASLQKMMDTVFEKRTSTLWLVRLRIRCTNDGPCTNAQSASSPHIRQPTAAGLFSKNPPRNHPVLAFLFAKTDLCAIEASLVHQRLLAYRRRHRRSRRAPLLGPIACLCSAPSCAATAVVVARRRSASSRAAAAVAKSCP